MQSNFGTADILVGVLVIAACRLTHDRHKRLYRHIAYIRLRHAASDVTDYPESELILKEAMTRWTRSPSAPRLRPLRRWRRLTQVELADMAGGVAVVRVHGGAWHPDA
jgi:hypothetical protein